MEGQKRIVLSAGHQSAVVKAIEKKLGAMGNQVEVVRDYGNEAFRTPGTELFLFYLPEDILVNESGLEGFKEACAGIAGTKSSLILIGEGSLKEALTEAVPQCKDGLWLNRPLDMQLLCDTVGRTLAGEKTAEETAEAKAEEKKRILIIDDDPSYAGMIRAWIRDEFRVDIVTSGAQAFRFLTKRTADLILLDYEMPETDGPEVLRQLRQDPRTEKLPVLFLTGAATEEAVRRMMEAKPEGYLLKSVTRDGLLEVLRKY